MSCPHGMNDPEGSLPPPLPIIQCLWTGLYTPTIPGVQITTGSLQWGCYRGTEGHCDLLDGHLYFNEYSQNYDVQFSAHYQEYCPRGRNCSAPGGLPSKQGVPIQQRISVSGPCLTPTTPVAVRQYIPPRAILGQRPATTHARTGGVYRPTFIFLTVQKYGIVFCSNNLHSVM